MGEVGVPPALVDAVDSIKDAIIAGRTDIFRKLLEACESCDGGGPEERKQLINSLATKEGSFLHMATKLGHADIVRALLASGADPGIMDREGNTPLQVSPSASITAVFTEDLLRATAQSEIGRVCQLIASGMSVNTPDNMLSKNTPLHWAASFADVDTIHCLIARGANVNSCNSDGASPLHDAVARGDKSIVEALLEQGANPHIRCERGRHNGQTPISMSEKKPQIKELLNRFKNEEVYGNGIRNGSVSPVMDRRSLHHRQGSIESLVSIGADSVILNGTDPKLGNHLHMNGRARGLSSVGEEFESTMGSSPYYKVKKCARSPLESTSSLEFSPNMQQVCERLSAVQLTTPPRPLVMSSALHHLWPQPKRITELNGLPWHFKKIIDLSIVSGPVPVHEIVDVWNTHQVWLNETGCDIQLECIVGPRDFVQGMAAVSCAVNPDITISVDHYTITIQESGISMICGSLSALHHAIVTLTQIFSIFQSESANEESKQNELYPNSKSDELPPEKSEVFIPSLVITDFPSLPNRGFMLDMSASARVPTLERICQIIDCLLCLKYNQLHLLFKIAATSPNTHLSGGESNTINGCNGTGRSMHLGPTCHCHLSFTPNELVSLERYCSDRGVLLIPGFDIDSTANLSIVDVSQTMADCLIHFPSAKFVHFGPKLSSFLVDLSLISGNTNVWSILRIPSNVTLMVCANVYHRNERALKYLPMPTILIEYGFQADYDFRKGCDLAVKSGRPLSICPGTAAWSSLAGWPEAGVSNVYSGVVSSLESGGVGIVVAQWCNTPSLTPSVFMWPPLFVAAGLAWNHSTHWDFVHSSVGSLIDRHLVRLPECGFGPALIELGRCETWATRISRDQASTDPYDLPSSNPGSTLHQLIADPDSVVFDYLTTDVFASIMRNVRKAVIKHANPSSPQDGSGRVIGRIVSNSKWPMATLAIVELQLAMDMILTACRLGRALVVTGTNPRSNMGMAVVNPGVANLPPTLRTDLANKVLALREVYSSVWLQGQQSPGLQSSLLVWTSLLARLLPEQSFSEV